jgi:hypothetical protein
MPPQLCRLCLQLKPLRSSHILPEFAFKPLYDQKHGAVEHTVSTASSRIIRKGYREKLLCDVCEGRFSALESYFANEWLVRLPLLGAVRADEHQFEGLDYARFKLFHLSVLWRAAISTRDEFKLIKLGPYEERLRVKLLNSDPGPSSEFAILVTLLVHPRTRLVERGIYLEPELVRVRGRHFTIFTFSGCGWYYAISSFVPDDFKAGTLQDDGSILADVQPFDEYTPLTKTFARLQHAKRTRSR